MKQVTGPIRSEVRPMSTTERVNQSLFWKLGILRVYQYDSTLKTMVLEKEIHGRVMYIHTSIETSYPLAYVIDAEGQIHQGLMSNLQVQDIPIK